MSGESDNWSALCQILSLEKPSRFPAIHHWQAHVHENQRGHFGFGHFYGFCSIDCNHNLKAFAGEAS